MNRSILLLSVSLAFSKFSLSQTWTVFTFPDKGAEIKFPANWTKEDNKDHPGIKTYLKKNGTDKNYLALAIFFQQPSIPVEGTMLVITDESVSEDIMEKENAKMIRKERRDWQSFPGLFYDYEYFDAATKSTIKAITWYIYKGETEYQLFFMVPKETEKMYARYGEEMLKSFKLFIDESPAKTFYNGYWQGLISYGGVSKKDSVNLEIINRGEDAKIIAYTSNAGTLKTDTFYNKYEKGVLKLGFFTTKVNQNTERCQGSMPLRQVNESKLTGSFETSDKGCMHADLVLVRCSEAVAKFANGGGSEITAAAKPGKEKKEPAAAKMPEGWHLLFSKAKTTLSDEEKKQIYQLLDFRIAKDGKRFVVADNPDEEYAFDATVTTMDLNGDNVPEVFVDWGNTFTSGMAGSSVSLFIKNGSGYTENLGFGGSVAAVIAAWSNGYPDLSFAVPGMRIPVWRYDGRQYQHHKSVSSAEYRQLKSLEFAQLQKNPALLFKTKPAAQKSPSPDVAEKPRRPNPAAKKLIVRRWKAVDVIGSGQDYFRQQFAKGETGEMEFGSNGKLYFYSKGLLKEAADYIMAPDGNSILVSSPKIQGNGTIEILSIKSNELVIKFEAAYQNNKVVFRPN